MVKLPLAGTSFYCPAQGGYDATDESQSEPDVKIRVFPGRVCSPEAVEDVGDLLLGEFATRVGNFDLDDAIGLAGGSPDSPVVIGILDGVL